MKQHAAISFLAASVVALVFGATKVEAQNVTSRLDPALLRRSSFEWTQAEREFGFAHCDLRS